jgi:hypothetical protein
MKLSFVLFLVISAALILSVMPILEVSAGRCYDRCRDGLYDKSTAPLLCGEACMGQD